MLIKVPSGSGNNMLTHFFAEMLSEKSKARVLRNDLIQKTHQVEAKKNLTLSKRNEDPIAYKIDAASIRSQMKGFNKVVVIDDLIGSGESSIKLVKTLEQGGVKVDSILNLVTVEKRQPSLADFHRLFSKLDSYLHLPEDASNKLKKDIVTVFSDYTRQKINRLERPLVNEKTAKLAVEAIAKAAVLERKFEKDIKQNLSL